MRESQGVWAGALFFLSALASCAEKSGAPMEQAAATEPASAAAEGGPKSRDPRQVEQPSPTTVTGGDPGAASATAEIPGPGRSPFKVGVPLEERKASVMQAFASDVGGKLDSADVEATIDKGGDRLRACVSVDSRVSVRMKILPSGAVADANVPKATPNDAKLRDCVAAALRKLVFPRPTGNEAASITMELDLRKQASP